MSNEEKVTVNDLAIYLVDQKNVNTPLLLQKILFLIRYEELKNKNDFGVFNEKDKFQAWIWGPVNKEIYYKFRSYFNWEDEIDTYKINNLKKIKKLKKYDLYIEKYMNIAKRDDVRTLVDLTHQNEAWIVARKNLDWNKPSTDELDEKLIPKMREEFFKILKRKNFN